MKLENQNTQLCPFCKKILPTSTQNEKSFFIGHKKECKKKSQNKNNINNNHINNNQINNNINIINPPINNINIINNPPPSQNNNIINNPSPNNNIIQNPNNPISNTITRERNKLCPKCKIAYRYDTQYFINFYNQHVKGCHPRQNNNINYSTYSNNNLPTVNRPIRVNANNQELNNILDAIGLETKKVLPRGKKDGTFEEKVDYLRFDISKKKIDFINGAEKLNINREKVLENSMEQFEKINPFKELYNGLSIKTKSFNSIFSPKIN
jgi:hypothetical protein